MIVSPQDDTDSLRPDADVDDVFFSFAVEFVHGSREPASPAFQGRFHRTSTPREYQKGGKLCCALQWKLTRSPPVFK